ncbi:MAG TPA: urate hydroxylase PuuD [Thermoanaerobaculia bacterium]|nr:urate hydroxylase PuuD [Thermoanaerobaculia bacterium]
MIGDLREWLHLVLRWTHVVAGAFWIGQTAFFTWLDAQSRRAIDEAQAAGPSPVGVGGAGPSPVGVGGAGPSPVGAGGAATGKDVWMVHSGGFYRVERVPRPATLPAKLHWFKWEAAASWISGILLLNLVYYHGGAMVASDSPVSALAAGAIGAGAIVLGWIVYDGLWLSPLERREPLGAAISLALLTAVAWGLCTAMSGRAAYIHIGSLFGTIMAANVWMRILPAQRKMVSAIERGEPLDTSLAQLAERAKQRSRHNTFLTLPLAFLMISNHFPTTSYGHRLNWLILWIYLLGGFAARTVMNRWDHRP